MLLLGKHGIIFLYNILTSLYVLYGHWYLTTPWPQAIMMTRLKLKEGFTRTRDVHSTMAFQIGKLIFFEPSFTCFLWMKLWRPIYLGVFPPNVAATFHPWWTTRIWLRKLRKLHGEIGIFRDRWNWMDSSLPDGIRWLLDDKTHKGCHGSGKKGCQFIIVLGCLIGTPLKVAGIYGMYGILWSFISVGVSILGEDVIISFLLKHLDFSSLPSCLARSTISFTPLLFTPLFKLTWLAGQIPHVQVWSTPSNVCDLSFLGVLEELFNERIVVWIPHRFSATNATLLLCQKKERWKIRSLYQPKRIV